jgi:4-hydroxybenzoate polyprenyltransferase
VLIAAVLMVVGITFAVVAGWPDPAVGVVAGVLAGVIVLYDGVLKHYWIGPLGMGACRFLNVLMGCLAASDEVRDKLGMVPFHVAGVVALYIVGVTWFARTEEGQSRRLPLVLAAGVMLLAVVSAALLPLYYDAGHTPFYYLYLLAGFGFVVGLPVADAIHTPTAKNVQRAVKRSILGLVLLDAVLACLFVGWPGLLIVLLLVPALLLGRWVYST